MLGHWMRDCANVNMECNICHQFGHKAKVCRECHIRYPNNRSAKSFSSAGQQKWGPPFPEQQKWGPPTSGQQSRQVKSFGTKAKVTENEVSRSDSDDAETINAISGPDPVFMTLVLNGVPVRLEFDTGSRDTIITKSVWSRIGAPTLQESGNIIAYGHSKVPALGRCEVVVQCREQTAILPLIVSNITSESSLLGRTWIETFKLVEYNPKVLHNIVTPGLKTLLQEFADIFSESTTGIKGVQATLHVRPREKFRKARARAVPFTLQPKVEEELQRLEKVGIIEKVNVAPKGTTPIVPVVKPNGSIRNSGDFKLSVNRIIDPQQYPMPRIDELLQSMANGERYSKIDLSDAYLQVEVDDNWKQYLVITTHRGLYRYNRLPFGVSAAPAIFQSVMDQIIQGLQATRAYIDDVSVTGRDDKDHLANLRSLFERFRKYGVWLKRQKSTFMADSMVYLGHQVTRFGTQPVDVKCKAIAQMPAPRNVKELEVFLGMVQFYSAYITNLSTTAGPFNAVRNKGVAWNWSVERDKAFGTLKLELQSRNVLAYFDEALPVGLSTDASNIGIGAVLYHIYPDGTERPIQYASKTLNSAERNYAQIEKEALAIIFGVKKF